MDTRPLGASGFDHAAPALVSRVPVAIILHR